MDPRLKHYAIIGLLSLGVLHGFAAGCRSIRSHAYGYRGFPGPCAHHHACHDRCTCSH